MKSNASLAVLPILLCVHLGCKSSNEKKAPLLEPETKAETESSGGLCDNSKPASYKETVAVLLRTFHLDTCEDLETDIASYTSVALTGMGLVDLSPIAEFTNLKQFSSTDNPISDASPLMQLKSLEAITIQAGNIENLLWLEDDTQLEELHLPKNKISSLEGIQRMKNIKDLSVGYNDIDTLLPLRGLPELEYLDISRNKIVDVSTLPSLPKLTEYFSLGNFEDDLSILSNSSTLKFISVNSKKLDKSNHKTCPRGPDVNGALSILCEN